MRHVADPPGILFSSLLFPPLSPMETPILKVQEIRGYDTVTKIANSPAFIKGVINMRGVIVPIIDLRLKFNLGQVEYNQFTVVIILNIDRVLSVDEIALLAASDGAGTAPGTPGAVPGND